MPKTNLGRWSAGTLIAFLGVFGLQLLLVASGHRDGEPYFSNPYLAVNGILAGLSALGTFFTGVFAIWKQGERSASVYIATFIGLLVLVFVVGELLSRR